MNTNYAIRCGIELPKDFPWRIRFVAAVQNEVKALRIVGGTYIPPRFMGYYLRGKRTIGIAGRWTVALDVSVPALCDPENFTDTLGNYYSIVCEEGGNVPKVLLVHDRHEEVCWLMGFIKGLQFVEANEPQTEGDEGTLGLPCPQ